jgi:hypothetical protein
VLARRAAFGRVRVLGEFLAGEAAGDGADDAAGDRSERSGDRADGGAGDGASRGTNAGADGVGTGCLGDRIEVLRIGFRHVNSPVGAPRKRRQVVRRADHPTPRESSPSLSGRAVGSGTSPL